MTGVNLVTSQCFKLKTSPNVFEVHRGLTRSVLPIISNKISNVRHTEQRRSSHNWNAMVSISLNDCNQSLNESIIQSINKSINQPTNQSINQKNQSVNDFIQISGYIAEGEDPSLIENTKNVKLKLSSYSSFLWTFTVFT